MARYASLPPGSFRTILAETASPEARRPRRKETMMTSRRTLIGAGVLALLSVAATPVLAADAPAGQMTWALLAVLQGVGPRVAESEFGRIADYPWSAPYEDVKLKTR